MKYSTNEHFEFMGFCCKIFCRWTFYILQFWDFATKYFANEHSAFLGFYCEIFYWWTFWNSKNYIVSNLHSDLWDFLLQNILQVNILHFWNLEDFAVNSLPKGLHFLLRNFYKGTFCTSEKVNWRILLKGNSDLQQYSNDETFLLASKASFFVPNFWFLRGCRARITSIKKMIETLWANEGIFLF